MAQMGMKTSPDSATPKDKQDLTTKQRCINGKTNTMTTDRNKEEEQGRKMKLIIQQLRQERGLSAEVPLSFTRNLCGETMGDLRKDGTKGGVMQVSKNRAAQISKYHKSEAHRVERLKQIPRQKARTTAETRAEHETTVFARWQSCYNCARCWGKGEDPGRCKGKTNRVTAETAWPEVKDIEMEE